ncbi:hypothetical protein TNCV_2687641 [Trichonephila clavipes]|nr:hypothetical protein TNCV_2687641 [Trichonephila clavipes]
MAEEVEIKDLDTHSVCRDIIPLMLNNDQKAIQMEMVDYLISAVDKNITLVGRIATGDEKWCFLFDPKSKRTSEKWKSPQSPPKPKFHQDRCKRKIIC